MADSNIEWTDKSWNPVTGCTKVSPGCKNCYAEGVADRFWGKQYPPVTLPTGDPSDPLNVRPRRFTDVMWHPDRLNQPLHWKKPARIFVNSMSDLFHEDVPDTFIDQVFAVMALAPQHTFQVLTKRADRMRTYMVERSQDPRYWNDASAALAIGRELYTDINNIGILTLPNVWLGVSVENQEQADKRIPLLLQTTAAIRFISAEPLLGPIVCTFDTEVGPLSWLIRHNLMDDVLTKRVDWVIVGGESGPKARTLDVAWARAIVAQCRAAGVPCFVKQLGKWPLSHQNENDHGGQHWVPLVDPQTQQRTGEYGCEARGAHGDPSEWPEDLRVREFPR